MSHMLQRVRKLEGLPVRRVFAVVWGKCVYRRVSMGLWEVRAGQSVAPSQECALTIEILDQADWPLALVENPHLSAEDLDHFASQRLSTCIVARDGTRLAGSTWMTTGRVYVSELQRFLDLPAGTHFSCRTHVHPDYRGMSVMGHMIHGYTARVPADETVCGLVYDWNDASKRALEKLGWRRTGEYWSVWRFGKRFSGERRTVS